MNVIAGVAAAWQCCRGVTVLERLRTAGQSEASNVYVLIIINLFANR